MNRVITLKLYFVTCPSFCWNSLKFLHIDRYFYCFCVDSISCFVFYLFLQISDIPTEKDKHQRDHINITLPSGTVPGSASVSMHVTGKLPFNIIFSVENSNGRALYATKVDSISLSMSRNMKTVGVVYQWLLKHNLQSSLPSSCADLIKVEAGPISDVIQPCPHMSSSLSTTSVPPCSTVFARLPFHLIT